MAGFVTDPSWSDVHVGSLESGGVRFELCTVGCVALALVVGSCFAITTSPQTRTGPNRGDTFSLSKPHQLVPSIDLEEGAGLAAGVTGITVAGAEYMKQNLGLVLGVGALLGLAKWSGDALTQTKDGSKK